MQDGLNGDPAWQFGVRLNLVSIRAVLACQGLMTKEPLQHAYQRDPVMMRAGSARRIR